MIPLDAADLVVIAGGALGIDTDTALGLLDVAACERALTQAQQGTAGCGGSDEPAVATAVLLDALIRHRPFAKANDLVAVAAAVQLLSLSGWQADLDPPGETRAMLSRLAARDLSPGQLADWLSPRLTPLPPLHLKETAMRRWMPRRKRPARRNAPFTRMSSQARQAIVAAQHEARGLCHAYIGTEHLLLGLLGENGGLAHAVLAAHGISPDTVRQQVLAIARAGDLQPEGHIPFTHRAKAALELSLSEATLLSQLFVSPEHLLLGLIREAHGVAAQVLHGLGADLDGVRSTVAGLLAAPGPVPGGQAGGPAGPLHADENDP